MRKYDREHYKIKAYKNEKFSLEIYDVKVGVSKTIFNDNYETLYIRAKEEAKKGKICSLWELKYEVIP